ncbi:hypothetical protein Purlil1_12852 [Purpureocillium lilacinum]|uniref:Uncharacterized protein n=1 Tax=Purpureocillium lilacinum TaxID=33203 RepID=A0ABR0BFR3_PURLI|nr:hypothetical protein Purlil1_12852 [Purpureocillium lilacinum]
MLNCLIGMTVTEPRISTEVLPGSDKPEKGLSPLPLPEDYALRGLLFTEHIFPSGWFDNSNLDEAERHMESRRRTLNREQRLERILWLGRRIASNSKGLTWDAKWRQFEETCWDEEREGRIRNGFKVGSGAASATMTPRCARWCCSQMSCAAATQAHVLQVASNMDEAELIQDIEKLLRGVQSDGDGPQLSVIYRDDVIAIGPEISVDEAKTIVEQLASKVARDTMQWADRAARASRAGGRRE